MLKRWITHPVVIHPVSFDCFNFDTCLQLSHPGREKLSVVILYERLAYVGKAVATYLHLIRELSGEFSPDFRLWRIDLALDPTLATEAERDLANAEVIIMALNGRKRCPPEFQRWKNGAGHGGGPAPHAVIALMEAFDEPVPAAESWSELLHGTTTQIHSEVFVCDRPASGPPFGESRTAALRDFAGA